MAVSFTQDSFRLRNDDGSETTATWKAAANTSISIDVASGNVSVRIRFALTETGTTASTFAANLFASLNGGAYAQVTAATTGAKVIDSTNFTDNANTTQQLSSGTFVAGRMDDVDGTTGATGSIAQNSVTDFEFMVQLVSADLASGNTLDFRCYKSGVAVAVYTNTPRISILKSATITATAGSYSDTGNATGLLHGYKVIPAAGSYADTGQTAGLLHGYKIAPTTGTYTDSGQVAGLLHGYKIAPATGAYVLTGQSAGLNKGYQITLTAGVYATSGQTVTFTKGGGAIVYTPTQPLLTFPTRATIDADARNSISVKRSNIST